MWQLPVSRWLISIVKPTSGYCLQIPPSWYYLHIFSGACFLGHLLLGAIFMYLWALTFSQYYRQVFLSTIFRYLLLGLIFMYLEALTFPQYCLQVPTSWCYLHVSLGTYFSSVLSSGTYFLAVSVLSPLSPPQQGPVLLRSLPDLWPQ